MLFVSTSPRKSNREIRTGFARARVNSLKLTSPLLIRSHTSQCRVTQPVLFVLTCHNLRPARSMYHPVFLAAFPDFPDQVARFRATSKAPEAGVEAALARLLGVDSPAGSIGQESPVAPAAAAAAAAAQHRAPRKTSSKFLGCVTPQADGPNCPS